MNFEYDATAQAATPVSTPVLGSTEQIPSMVKNQAGIRSVAITQVETVENFSRPFAILRGCQAEDSAISEKSGALFEARFAPG